MNKEREEDFERRCINALRILSVDQICSVGSGHPGLPMGAAAMAHTLWNYFLNHNPKNPGWLNRDRVVFSAGHGSSLLYSLLYLSGYDLNLAELTRFRQFGSKTPGHPEYGNTPGVEATTGPLGQGFATAVGIALAEKILASRYNKENFKIFDYYTYVIVSDGDLMEGISYEAAAFAGKLELKKLICLFDSNDITIDGNVDLVSSEDIKKRFEACNWEFIEVVDGNNARDIKNAIFKAQKSLKPSMISVKTIIGYGNPLRQGTPKAHSGHFLPKELELVRKTLGWKESALFKVPAKILKYYREAIEIGAQKEREWNNLFERYKARYIADAYEIERLILSAFETELNDIFTNFKFVGPEISTREVSGQIMNQIAERYPGFIGGSADLASSCKTYLNGFDDVNRGGYGGYNINFGIREHAMGAVLSGLALSKMFKPFGSTFLAFSNYLLSAIRNCALMNLPVIYIFSHDSIGVGKDGPTHQPVEQLMTLRLMPNLTVIRPADAAETVVAWEFIMKNATGPVALILTRQAVPIINRKKYALENGLLQGAYVMNPQIKTPQAIIFATGSEVNLALKASERLLAKGVKARVVSMPSWEIFEKQNKEYKNKVLAEEIKIRISIEAGSTLGWHKYVGLSGTCLGVDEFGMSAPMEPIFDHFGLTVENIIKNILNKLEKFN